MAKPASNASNTANTANAATVFVRACRGEPTPHVPVWLMRQAGRYLPQYQALRARASFLDLCTQPELAAQATLDAAAYLGTDAAIIFSDITLPGQAMGLPLVFDPGPKFRNPVRTLADVRALRAVDPARDLGYVLEAIRLTRAKLPRRVSLIGFVGAPLTLAAYMVEGEPTRSFVELKRLLYGAPDVAHALLALVTEVVTAHAAAQLDAGCDAVQLFDSHAGELAERELKELALPMAARAVAALRPKGAPVIYFARGIGAHIEEAAAMVQPDVLGLDWTVSITSARERLGSAPALMGNLDPGALFAPKETVVEHVRRILEEGRGHPGFIFNLGHGVLPNTPPENALAVVEAVHAWR